jgi:hypothetical protein
MPVSVVPYIFVQPAVKKNPKWKVWVVQLAAIDISPTSRELIDSHLAQPYHWLSNSFLTEALPNLSRDEAIEVTPQLLQILSRYGGTNIPTIRNAADALSKNKIEEAVPVAIRLLKSALVGYPEWESLLSSSSDRPSRKSVQRDIFAPVSPIENFSRIEIFAELLADIPTQEARSFLLQNSNSLIHYAVDSGNWNLLRRLIEIQEPQNQERLVRKGFDEVIDTLKNIESNKSVSWATGNYLEAVTKVLIQNSSSQPELISRYLPVAERSLRISDYYIRQGIVSILSSLSSRAALDILIRHLDFITSHKVDAGGSAYYSRIASTLDGIFGSPFLTYSDLDHLEKVKQKIDSLIRSTPNAGVDAYNSTQLRENFKMLEDKLREYDRR